MPVYNGEKYLSQALQSLSEQTFQDFRILAVNDCSTDHSGEILEQYAQSHLNMEVVHFEKNHREDGTMNYLLERLEKMPDVEYAALMHCDDISLPERFAKQIAFLDQHPQIHVLGTFATCINAEGDEIRTIKIPEKDDFIKAHMAIARNNLCHPTIMWRNHWFCENHIRFGNAVVAGDFEMWIDCALRGATFANLAEPLFKYRLHKAQQSNKINEINDVVQPVLEKYYARLFPILSDEERANLAFICYRYIYDEKRIQLAEQTLDKIRPFTESVLGENRRQTFNVLRNSVALVKSKAPKIKKLVSTFTISRGTRQG
ncbi:glycosyltransferase [Cricetibacter osteomyelitidis]|nr:glycosyltransferase [Cricetibacter osteomyelitidis]